MTEYIPEGLQAQANRLGFAQENYARLSENILSVIFRLGGDLTIENLPTNLSKLMSHYEAALIHVNKQEAEYAKQFEAINGVIEGVPMTQRTRAQKSLAELLICVSEKEVEAFLSGLSANALKALPWMFEFWALPHQITPKGDWSTWVIMGGRGAGKTRAGAEWVRNQVEGARPMDKGKCQQIALVGETYAQARDVMVFGDSGILACCPPDRRPKWEATRRRLVWPNGAVATCYSASDPEALRGPQFDGAWVDELGCPAIDKGTNQPNVFLDTKSSESAVPYYSNGMADSYLQRQYLNAMHG